MAERPGRVRPLGLLTAGLLLAALPALLGTTWAAAGPVLAQPLILLGWSGLRGSRDLARPRFRLLADALSVSTLWILAFALTGLVAAWPVQALLDNGSLVPALVLSLCGGCVLLGLWRLWPSFAQAARHGQPLAALFGASSTRLDGDAPRGLGITGIVFLVIVAGLALVWPDAMEGNILMALRWGFPALALLAHAGIHRLADQAPATVTIATPVATAEPTASTEPVTGTADERLVASLRAGRVEAGIEAIAAGADPLALPAAGDRDQRTLIMLAALQGDLRLLRQLIGRGVDVNQRHGGLTALLAATRDSWHGRPEAVMTLLANGADARLADNEGNTPLHHASRSTDPAVAALLLDAGAQVDTLNADGCSPLWIACACGNWRLARFLIEHGARAEPAGGQPALLAAVSGDDDPGGAQLLLRHKARVDARGPAQRTALLQAAAAGNVDIVAVLLEAGADRNAADANGMTALLEAAANGHAAVVTRLAQARVNAHVVDGEQRNALQLACHAGASPDLLRQLMALGIDPQQADAHGRRAIEVAIEHGRWPLVALLDPSYALPASITEGISLGETEKTPLQLLREALDDQRWSAAEAIPALMGASANAALSELLLDFSQEPALAVFDWLCRHGASADWRPDAADSVLFQLFDAGGSRHGALQRLLDRGQAVGGDAGLARFLGACERGEHTSGAAQQLALALVERGADVFGAQPGQDAPLLLAIRLGWQRVVDSLLVLGVDPNQRDTRGQPAIHVAAALGREAALRGLIRAGALPQARSPDGQTALGMALSAGRSDLSHWLEWRGWPLPGRPLQPADLPAAAIAGDLDAIRRLLELGLPVDASDAQGCTALLRAAGGGHGEIVKSLLSVGADLNASARTGATPLSAAISMRHAGVVDQLLQAGADANQPLPGGVTPLMLAAALGLPDIAGRLLSQGARVEAIDDHGLTALHCAALHAFTARDRQRVLALFDLLLQAELTPDAASASGHTPLLLLLGARAEAGAACDEDVLLVVLERLFNEGIALDAQDQRGLSALHLAAMHGLLGVVQRLLREGANRQLRDTLGRTPYDLALLRGYVDIASEFEPARPAPSLARFLREPR